MTSQKDSYHSPPPPLPPLVQNKNLYVPYVSHTLLPTVRSTLISRQGDHIAVWLERENAAFLWSQSDHKTP